MKDIYFTKTMIQNYNRVGALPPLINNRQYGRVHLVYLYYINLLKSDFSLKEIKEILDNLNIYADMLVVHKRIIELQSNVVSIRENYINSIKALTTSEDEANFLMMIEILKIKNFSE